MNDPKYFDLNDAENVPEVIDPSEVETSDYTGQDLIPVGSYLSAARDIKVSKQRPDGTRSFEISLTGGISDPETGRVFGLGSFPVRTWISTKQFEENNRTGKTSTVAKYLRACGINPQEAASITEALADSRTMPVMVYIGWTSRDEKQADGTYKQPDGRTKALSTRDFNIGTKDAPQYVGSVTLNGVQFTAKHKVGGFNRVK